MHEDRKIIYQPNLYLDLNLIKKIVFETQYSVNTRLDASHHRLVKDHEYLREVQDRFPYLSDIYNIYTLPALKNIPLHVDAKRNAAFNIPIDNTEQSETFFYEYMETPILEYDSKNVYNLIKSKVKEIYRFTLLTPTIINNSIPHMVVNHSVRPRIILSWSLKKEYKFDDGVEYFYE